MRTKTFALMASATISGIVSAAGCSEQNATARSTDAGADVGRPQLGPPDLGDEDAAPFDAGSPGSCDPIDATKFPYTKALVAPGACTTLEAKALVDFFKAKEAAKEDVLISEWSKTVSAGCAACVFSDGTGATWTPILAKDDKLDNVNRGGCIEILSANEACARTYQQMTGCRDEVERNPCWSAGPLGGPDLDWEAVRARCGAAYDAMVNACGPKLGSYESACFGGMTTTFEGPIRKQCIAGGG